MGVCTGPLLRGSEWFDRTGEKSRAWLDSHGYADLAAIRGMALPTLHAWKTPAGSRLSSSR